MAQQEHKDQQEHRVLKDLKGFREQLVQLDHKVPKVQSFRVLKVLQGYKGLRELRDPKVHLQMLD